MDALCHNTAERLRLCGGKYDRNTSMKRILLIATGGTAKAATDLIEKAGGTVVGFSFVMRLDGLDGLDKLDGKPSSSLIAMPA